MKKTYATIQIKKTVKTKTLQLFEAVVMKIEYINGQTYFNALFDMSLDLASSNEPLTPNTERKNEV